MNPDYKKILIRLPLLIGILILSAIIYQHFFFEKDLVTHSPNIELVRAIDDATEIVYLGESSNFTSRDDDADKRPISAFIADFYPSLKMTDISKAASHAEVYKSFLENIPETSKIKTVIVTLNMRSFDAQWMYSDLETSIQKGLVLMNNNNPAFLNRFLLSFKAYDIKTEKERTEQVHKMWKNNTLQLPTNLPYKNAKEWDAYQWSEGIKDKNGNKDEAATILACHYIKAYAFEIDTTNHPRIKDFNDIVKIAKKRNWNLVFNLMAENTEKAEKLVGQNLISLMNKNRDLVKKYYEKQGVLVIDNMTSVEDEQFIDQTWTTEHYAEKGRKIIAKNVAIGLQKYHKNQFKNVLYDHENIITNFFIDCEQKMNHWNQFNTVTNEKGFSGSSSSKINQQNPYSLTLEYPFKKFPKENKNTVTIKCKVYQPSLTHNTQLAIELQGDKIENSWNGFSISQKATLINQWCDYEYTFTVPDDKKEASMIKVYFLNESNQDVFIDDIRIDFK